MREIIIKYDFADVITIVHAFLGTGEKDIKR